MSIFHKPKGSLPEAKRFAVSVPATRVGTRASGLRNRAAFALRLARTILDYERTIKNYLSSR